MDKRAAGRRPRAGGRDPQRTREALLDAAFRKVHRSGFHGTDVDSILAEAGVTKGALYHHFESKEALGYALVEERLATLTRTKWLEPLESGKDPIDVLVSIVQETSTAAEPLQNGCPLNNLSQEMSPLDEGFRRRTAKVFADWQGGIAAALREGRRRGLVRAGVDPEETATFFVALYEGYISLAKSAQDAVVLRSGKRQMVRFLESLRPGAQEAASARRP